MSSFGITLKCWGDYACFTRPEMKVERVSYDVITPSAARGILEAIYWKPQIRWKIDRLHVMKPIQFTSVRRNELGCIATLASPHIYIEDHRQQRAALILKDVEYIIEAHFELLGGDDPPAKHKEMFDRRATKGQYYHHPYLGCREFPAEFALLDSIPPSPLHGERDLGWMLYDIDFAHNNTALFFHAIMRNGIIDLTTAELRS
ncbi:MAG: type I-C CRISPR-associated protein Cas5c [bacterium]|nr:type I-C CRISPR-associated protein Cas5c [bacterium]